MKKLIVYIFLSTMILFQSCDKKGPGDNYDFTNSLPPYVEISSKADLKVTEGNTATIAVRLKTAMQEPIVVNYVVSGAFSTTGTVTIQREALTANVSIPVPTALVPSNLTSTSAIFTITSATKGTTKLTIGALGADKEKRTLVIQKM